MKLYLLRHGRTLWNEEGRLQGRTDVPLSDEGRCSALAAGAALESVPFDAAFSSPLQRARETAELILRGKNIAVQESTTAHIYAQEELGIEPLAFKNANECATAVMGGKADAAILDKVPAQTLAMANPDALETVEQLLTEEEMAMGVAKGNEELLEVVNSVLQKAMDDGTVESLTDKHLKICAEG